MRIFKLTMVDTKTGEQKEIPLEFTDGCSDEGIDYMLTEGNYACDCNRYNMFYPESEDDIECYSGDYPQDRFFLVKYEEVKNES